MLIVFNFMLFVYSGDSGGYFDLVFAFWWWRLGFVWLCGSGVLQNPMFRWREDVSVTELMYYSRTQQSGIAFVISLLS